MNDCTERAECTCSNHIHLLQDKFDQMLDELITFDNLQVNKQ